MNKKYIILLSLFLSGCASFSAYSDMNRYYCNKLASQIDKKEYVDSTEFFNDVYQSINEENLSKSLKQSIFVKWSLKPINKESPNYMQETNLIYQESNKTCPLYPPPGRSYPAYFLGKSLDFRKIGRLHNSTLEQYVKKEVNKQTKGQYKDIAPLDYWFYGQTFSKDYLYQIGGNYKIRVVENIEKGIIVSLPYFYSDDATRYIFIKHNSKTKNLVDDDFLPNGLLKYNGTFSYYTVLGARKTVNSFEYIKLAE